MSKRQSFKVTFVRYDENLARQVAEIVGPYSGAARALAQLQRRRDEGEDVYLWTTGSSILVGPDPENAADIE